MPPLGLICIGSALGVLLVIEALFCGLVILWALGLIDTGIKWREKQNRPDKRGRRNF